MRALPLFALAMSALGIATCAAGGQEATSGVFAGHGRVEAVQAKTGVLTIKHGDIKGFMPAMEMMYKVKRPELSKDLRPGDVIDFKIDASNYTIVEVKVATPRRNKADYRTAARNPAKSRPRAFARLAWQAMQLDGASCR